MSTLAAGKSGRAPSRLPQPEGRAAGIAVAAALAAVALGFAWDAGVKSTSAVPDVARVLAAAGLLFTAAGYAPARLLLPRAMLPHLAVAVPLVGAAVSSLALTVLGFLHIPIEASLAIVVGGGAVAGVLLRRRRGPARAPAEDLAPAGGVALRLLWPAYIVALIVSITLIPTWRAGFASTTGQNGDAVVAAGTAEFLSKTPPRGEDTDLYVDRMPSNWRSKYPIYYALAGVSELSGLAPTQAFATMMSLMLAMAAAGFFLLAYHALAAGAIGALLVMALVPFDRILVYLTVQPFYNQIWGVFALPLILLFGLRFLREPSRGAAGLTLLFLALGAFAYPLMLPFALLPLGLTALILWRRHRAEGSSPGWIAALELPRGRRARIGWIATAVILSPAAAIAVLGVLEKAWAAAEVVVPGSDLTGWNALPVYLPLHKFFGFVDPLGIGWLPVACLLLAAGWWCLRLRRETGVPLAVTIAAALLAGAYFMAREHGAFFYFKDLSFLGPLVVAVAVAGLAGLAAMRSGKLRALGLAGLAFLALNAAVGSRLEAFDATPQLTREILELRDWARELPPGSTYLIAVPPSGQQLWAGYMLAEHPVSATEPLVGTTFPFPPGGLKADYLVDRPRERRPPRRFVVGPPVRRNATFRVWRMRRDLPYRDNSSRRSIENFSSVFE